MDGSPRLEWHAGNAEVTALALRRACLQVQGEDSQALHFDRQKQVIEGRMPAVSALSRIAVLFGLDALACDVLTLIALSDQPPALSAPLQEHPLSNLGRATRGVIEEVLGPGSTAALAPSAPLMAQGLVHEAPGRLFERPMSLSTSVLEALHGRTAHDPLWHDVTHAPADGPVPQDAATRLARALSAAMGQGVAPVFYTHAPAAQAEPLLGAVGAALDLPVRALNLADVPAPGAERAAMLQALRRDGRLNGVVIVCDAPEGLVPDFGVPLLLAGVAPDAPLREGAVCVPVPAAHPMGSADWQPLLADNLAKAQAAEVSATYALSPAQARRAAGALAYGMADDLWQAVQAQSSSDMGPLAQPIAHLSQWDDLVLPDQPLQALEQMTHFLAHRHQVNVEWGFAGKTPRGLGMAALFHGVSGTGKTTAAEAVVRRMQEVQGTQITLYRVNVAALVSKYIGETAKNFQQVFQAGAASGAALVFDECEGLFGKRTAQTRDSLDKHSNAELGYLLQCLESYPGIAILTTNMRDAIDDAFFRRFRFAIEFPFPDEALRRQIWERVIPDAVPRDGVDVGALAGLSLAGGHIRAVALNAAYLAAAQQAPLTMSHMAAAARMEFAKLERPVPEHLLAGWG
ncbi:ATPase AAA [Actibacterium atlanticum]|uniref:ATPase AAA n=1 Tax=Actibacterium atlanticum TaxID=1461693 RepID=A0A058ZQ13_9RHOB|nr:AAA family ATPase [Actibacterium atlanticum]KCV83674.1 ATPase AAA [Actibacterium atlanticum]